MYKNELFEPGERYVISAQQVAVTIASGSTTGTATINAVDTTTSFLVPGYCNSSATNSGQAVCHVQLTNATTVTATRNASAANTCVAYATVYFFSRRLVKSVQQGTIALSSVQASNTATINSVNTAKSVAIDLGSITAVSSTTGSCNNWLPRIALTNATTVTASLNTASAANTVAYVVVEFQPNVVTQVQQIAAALTGTNTTDTATLSPVVDMNRTLLFWGGSMSATTALAGSIQNAQLTANNTITFARTTGTSANRTVNVTAVEFAHGVLRSIRRGTTVLAAATSNTSALAFVDPNYTWLMQLGYQTSATSFNTGLFGSLLTNGTTETTKVNSAATGTASWEAAWFN